MYIHIFVVDKFDGPSHKRLSALKIFDIERRRRSGMKTQISGRKMNAVFFAAKEELINVFFKRDESRNQTDLVFSF